MHEAIRLPPPPHQYFIKRPYAQYGTVFLFSVIEDVINCNNSGNVSYVRPSSHHLVSSWLSTLNTFRTQCLTTHHDMFIFKDNCNINLTYILCWCLWRNCEWIWDRDSRLNTDHELKYSTINTVNSLPSMDQDLKEKTLCLLKDNVSP